MISTKHQEEAERLLDKAKAAMHEGMDKEMSLANMHVFQQGITHLIALADVHARLARK